VTTTHGVWVVITNQPEYSFLLPAEAEHQEAVETGEPGKPFSSKTKSAAFLAQALPTGAKCHLCDGLLHTNGMTGDHKIERSQGGSSAIANARYVHPICNSNRKAMGL
jgi:5-methylcytosine-specific restriction endonuclease McrA